MNRHTRYTHWNGSVLLCRKFFDEGQKLVGDPGYIGDSRVQTTPSDDVSVENNNVCDEVGRNGLLR